MIYKSKRIKFNNISDVSLFVNAAEKVKGDVIVKSGNRFFDAASILGMVGIASREAIIVFYPEDAEDFDIFIKKYI